MITLGGVVALILGWLLEGLLIKWLTYELTDAGYIEHTATYVDALQIGLPLYLLLMITVGASSRN